MQMTFRWFGKDLDTVSLEQIKQIPGVENVRRNHGSRLDDGMYRKRKCSRGY